MPVKATMDLFFALGLSAVCVLAACVSPTGDDEALSTSTQSVDGEGRFDDIHVHGTEGDSVVTAGGMEIAGKIRVGPMAVSSTNEMLFSRASATTTSQIYLSETDTHHTAYEAINLVADQRATFDTAAGPASANGVTALVSSTRVAGAHPLVNAGFIASVDGGDTNYSFLGVHGVLRNDDGAILGATAVTDFIANGVVEIVGAMGSTFLWHGNATIYGDVAYYGDASFAGNVRTSSNSLWFTDNSLAELYVYAESAGGTGDQNINIQAGGTGEVRINSNTGGVVHAGTGGLGIYGGNNDSTANAKFDGSGNLFAATVRTGGSSGPKWSSGRGQPSIACSPGDLFSRTDGGVSTTFYVCTAPDTWTAK